MNSRGVPLAGLELAQKAVSPSRLRQIAQNKLNALAIPTYYSKDLLRGRFHIQPKRLVQVHGLVLEPVQHIVVDGHDKFWFVKPSPLRFLGPIPFFMVKNQQEIHQIIEHRWRGLLEHSRTFHTRARGYFPSAAFDFGTWSIQTHIRDQFGEVTLRVMQKGPELYCEAVALDGKPLPPGDDRPQQTLPAEPTVMEQQALAGLIAKVRRRQGHRVEDEEAIHLDLGIMEPSEDIHVTPPQEPSSPLSEDLSLDLSLPTDDLMAEAPDLEPPELEAKFITEVAPEKPAIKRSPRLEIAPCPGRVRWAGTTVNVKLHNANQGGVFAALSLSEAPDVGSIVHLEGFGPLRCKARVAHQRTAAEAALFNSQEGVGLAFAAEEGSLIQSQDRPAALLLLEGRALADASICAPGVLKLAAPDLVTAALMTRVAQVGVIVMGASIWNQSPESIAAALKVTELGIKGLALDPQGAELGPFLPCSGHALGSTLERLIVHPD